MLDSDLKISVNCAGVQLCMLVYINYVCVDVCVRNYAFVLYHTCQYTCAHYCLLSTGVVVAFRDKKYVDLYLPMFQVYGT